MLPVVTVTVPLLFVASVTVNVPDMELDPAGDPSTLA